MGAPDLLDALRDAGLTVSADGDRLSVAGPTSALERFRPAIREQKDALLSLLKVDAGGTAAEPFDRESFEERAAVAEFDGGLPRPDAEALAWQEDDRRRCRQCLNLRGDVCSIAKPGGLVSANRGYRPVNLPMRCAGYSPTAGDKDQRAGAERWPGLAS